MSINITHGNIGRVVRIVFSAMEGALTEKIRSNQEFSHLFDYDMDSLLGEVQDGAILFCFGAGKALGTFLQSVSSCNVENYITAIVDNDSRKNGMLYHGRDTDIPIVMLDKAIRLVNASTALIIIITSMNFTEIYEHLKNHPRFRNMRIAFYGFLIDHFFEDNAKNLKCNIAYEKDVHIPKVIHYCWFGKKKIPDIYQKWMKSWKIFCPDYEIVEWNERNYDVNKHPYMAQAYAAGQMAFVSDYARLDIVYHHGGVYLDTDVEILRAFDPLMHQKGFIGYEREWFTASGLGFGAIPHHAVIRYLRDDYDGRFFILPDGSLNITSAPIYQTCCLVEKGLKKNGIYQEVDGIHVYPWTFFDPIQPYSGRLCLQKNTFSIHHYAGSWINTREQRAKQRIMDIYRGFD